MSVSKDQLAAIRQDDCLVSLKVDGVRYICMLCEHRGDFKAYFIDRCLRIYEVIIWAREEYFVHTTILDGELLWDVQTDNMVFLVFDAIRMRGEQLNHALYTDRLQKIHDNICFSLPESLDEESAAAEDFIFEESKIYAPSTNHRHLSLRPKRFVNLEGGASLWNDRHSIPYASDGLIIIRNKSVASSGTQNDVLKWKPFHAIDVSIDVVALTVFCRDKGKDVPFETLNYNGSTLRVMLQTNQLVECLKHRDVSENPRSLVECFVSLEEKGELRLFPLKERIDKAESNDLRVIRATVKTIFENISIEDLFAPRSDFVVDEPQGSPSSAADETPRGNLVDPPADSAKGHQRVLRDRTSQKRPHEPGDEGADGPTRRGSGVQTRGKAKRSSRE